MNCKNCNGLTKKNGKDRNGNQRFRCLACNITFTASKDKALGSIYLPEDNAVAVLNLLVDGISIRSIERVTGTNRKTILSLLETVGEKCLWIQENLVNGLQVKDIQADEIWSFIQMKDKTNHRQNIEDENIGSVYTFTAIDSDSKLIVAWHLGRRNEQDALMFLEKVYAATEPTKRFQLSTDSFKGYDHTVNELFRTKRTVSGNPIKEKISTSYVERQNLTMRMSMRRFTRLTNAFSKKWENHNYTIALHFAHYNFCRGHKTLNGATPAMAAGLTNKFWTLKDIISVATQN